VERFGLLATTEKNAKSQPAFSAPHKVLQTFFLFLRLLGYEQQAQVSLFLIAHY